VKVEMPRKSRTTISSAFLFEASSAQTLASGSESILSPPCKVRVCELFVPLRLEPNNELSGR
jgi:hypothetical protein